MARKRYTPEQIIRLLRGAEVFIAEGMTAAEAARKVGVSEQTYYRWRKGVWWDASRAGQAAEDAGAGECTTEASGHIRRTGA